MNDLILVHLDFGAYTLSVHMEEGLKYSEEKARHGEKFDEVMFQRALRMMQQDGVGLPPRETTYDVEPY